MSASDEDEYGGIEDDDLIEALSQQASQTLPPLRGDNGERRGLHRSRTGSGVSGDEDENGKSKKRKYRIHIAEREVSPPKIIGATQADGLPDSSPYRIRGPIYKKPRPPPKSPTPPRPRYVPPKPPDFFAATIPPTPLQKPLQSRTPIRQISGLSQDENLARELEGLPSDAFSSPENEYTSKRPISIGSSSPSPPPENLSSSLGRKRLAAPQSGLHQTTLFGGRAPVEVSLSQARKVYNYRVDKPPEPPTHHALDREALKTWVYPTNLGAIRDYQYTIVRNALFNNTLVALPTGLGKTFIAATVMLNFFRWTKDAQIVFVAPTKPLVAQQVDACFNIVGLPRSTTTLLTGEQAPPIRKEEWLDKRVFFMTPQTLINDLSTGIADPKKIVLVVVDEAHRATGDYAYVKVVQFIRRFNPSFRILALTATPGANVESVQEVIDGLEISKVEIRTEESIDIRQFVHARNIDTVLLDPSDEIIRIKELFSKALQPLVNLLCGQNAYYNKDPMSLTSFGLVNARKAWFASDAGRRANKGIQGMLTALFSVLGSVAHAIKLLNFHGIGPFYSTVLDFRQSVADGKKGGKYRNQVIGDPNFKKMMDLIQMWLGKSDFIGHPKLTYLCDTILNHFLDAGEGRLPDGAPPSSTRVIVFSEYRESAEDIAKVLNKHGPMVRASVFVGQADSKRSEGMNQAKQQETINKFKSGVFNVIVATSIGEEGLDIGQVDLIVCYDASGSPIRMLQRMGRTGRKRAGNITLLLMRGKEQDSFEKAKDNYEKMQAMITNGDRFNFRHDLSARIIPRDITPVVDKRDIEIPVENTQDTSLPEPKRRRPKKATTKHVKKFHMPDGVETGFRKASNLSGNGGSNGSATSVRPKKNKEADLEPIPELESVLLNQAEVNELTIRFQSVAGTELQEVEMPKLINHPVTQRSLLPIVNVPHGEFTKKAVRVLKIIGNSRVEDRFARPYGDQDPESSWSGPELVDESEAVKAPVRVQRPAAVKRKQPQKRASIILNDENNGGRGTVKATKRQPAKRSALSLSVDESDGDEQSGPPSSEGEGDDLANSEEPSEDESEIGSLANFLATSSPMATRTQQSTRSSPPSSRLKNQIYEPTKITATQETNDSMPDMDDLLGVMSKRKSQSPLEGVSTDDSEEVNIGPRGRTRRVVEDDSDE